MSADKSYISGASSNVRKRRHRDGLAGLISSLFEKSRAPETKIREYAATLAAEHGSTTLRLLALASTDETSAKNMTNSSKGSGRRPDNWREKIGMDPEIAFEAITIMVLLGMLKSKRDGYRLLNAEMPPRSLGLTNDQRKAEIDRLERFFERPPFASRRKFEAVLAALPNNEAGLRVRLGELAKLLPLPS